MLAALPAYAQGVYGKVELVDQDAATAVFYAESTAPSKDLAFENAQINALRAILYEGVADFNRGEPLVKLANAQTQNHWLKGLFDGKYATYKTYLGGTELIDDFTKEDSNFRCKIHVIVKYEVLKRQVDTVVNNTSSPSHRPKSSGGSWMVR